MEITRKGRKHGLDIDYEVRPERPEDVANLHEKLLKAGLLFLYATGGKPFFVPTENTVFHYIDENLKLYDFAIVFTKQARKPLKTEKTKLDSLYEKARNNASFKRKLMKYMRLHVLLYAMNEHMKAYGEPLKDPVLGRLKTILPSESEYTIHSLKALDHKKLAELE
jgi:hypothetical protein